MLIESYDLEIEVSTHSTAHFEYEAHARLQVDISAALPYLNATLSRGIYLPEKNALSWRHEGHNIGFWPYKISVDHLDSKEEAREIVERLVGMVNQVWEKRDEIEPDRTTHKRLQPLELYRLLPRINCKRCGEETCFNFSLKLAAAQAELASCRPLYEDETYRTQREQLENLLAVKWPAL